MSKTLSLDQLKKLAKDVFQSNPNAEFVYATPDGNLFLPENKNAAELHSKGNKNLRIYKIENEDYSAPSIEDQDDEDGDPFNDKKELSEMTAKELAEVASKYPEEEWKGKNKKDLLAYLLEKEGEAQK